MMTRRNLLMTLGGTAALTAQSKLWAAGQLAWDKPIGLETYTVRDLFSKDPGETLKQVAAIGYKEIEFNPGIDPALLKSSLQGAGLTGPELLLESPKTVDDWKKTLNLAEAYGVHYVVVGDNPRMDVAAWKQRAALYNQCGKLAQDAGMQLCYHAHYNEYARQDNTSGYDIMLTECPAKNLNMEMDVFWATYAGVDPLHYWNLHPGRSRCCTSRISYKNVAVNPHEDPPDGGPNPFAPVGQGKIEVAGPASLLTRARRNQHIFW